MRERPWVLLWIWCGQQFNREDWRLQSDALLAAMQKRRDVNDVTKVFLIDPDGYMTEIQKATP